MKVAMWTSWETRCGVASYTASLVDALREHVEVDIVHVPYEDRDAGRAAERLERLNAADLVHIQHEYTFWGGIVPGASTLPGYLAELGKPYVVTAHTVFTAGELLGIETEERTRQRVAKRLLASYPPFRSSVERTPFQGAAAVIVHTQAARERMLQRGLSPERVHVLPAGLPEPSAEGGSPEEVAALRERLGFEASKVLTIFGYVTSNKGYEVVFEALASLPPAVKLLIAGGTRIEGERPYMEQLRTEIKRRGLTRRVAITGFLDDRQIATAMAMTDLVLVPHTAANGSYSVMFGLAYGKPVLASDLACFKELADEAGCVELFPNGDERALAERIGFLLASATARKDLAEATRKYAASRSWRVVGERTVDVYREALARVQNQN